MFGDLEGAIVATVATSLFKVQVHEAPRSTVGNLQLRHEGASTSGTDPHENIPTAVPAGGKEPGRNDPCPCGSGKKYKKCGMINAPEHKG